MPWSVNDPVAPVQVIRKRWGPDGIFPRTKVRVRWGPDEILGIGQAAGTYTFAATATGKKTQRGTATGTYTWVGMAIGPSRQGTASGAYAFAGTATGKKTQKGTGSGAYTWAGSATGDAPVSFTPFSEVDTARTNQPVPAGAVYYRARLVGAGGGGGSGRRGSSGGSRRGGAGGAGGAYIDTGWRLTNELGSTYSVARGTGGTGGPSAGTGQDGTNGTAGGASTFSSGSISLAANGGAGGIGGDNSTSAATAATGGTASASGITPAVANNGGNGGVGSTAANAPAATSMTNKGAAGGGAGGSINSADTRRDGGRGGNTPIQNGGAAGPTATTAGGPGSPGPATALGVAGPGGGGGGPGTSSTDSSKGGDGVGYGAGAGGGGARQIGTGLTTGGNGGPGNTIIEWDIEIPAPPTIQFVGAVHAAAASVSLTGLGLQADDTIICFAIRDGSSTVIPDLPTGFTDVAGEGANTITQRTAYKLRATGSETTVAAANANSMIVAIYRNVGMVGVNTRWTAATADPSYVGLTLFGPPSWVVGMAGHRSTNGTLNAPTGMTTRIASADSLADLALHDTNGAVSSWGTQTPTTGETASGWQSCTLELIP